jgi:hypothetical protein
MDMAVVVRILQIIAYLTMAVYWIRKNLKDF